MGVGPASAAPPPSVTSISPTSGPTAGKTQVTITGTYFVNVTGVVFGTAPAKMRQTASNQLVATAPASLPGTVDVRVRTTWGTSPITPADRYTYLPSPTVTSVSPNSGSTDGGTAVTVTGTEFGSGATVMFGSAAATIVGQTATSLTVTSPPSRKAGPVDVRVTTPYGTSPSGVSFTYVSPPSIAALSPNLGPISGGNQVTLTVTNLRYPVTVTFGGSPATLSWSTPNTVTVVAPSHAAGPVDVRVSTPYGLSALVSADRYTYVGPPTITGIDPAGGGTPGGTQVTVTGTGFVQVYQVTFGGVPATIRGNPSSTTLVVMTPSHPQGVVDVRVQTAFGQSALVPADEYTYVSPAQPVITSVAPSSGSTRGGTQVTISGSSFNDLTSVTFGNRAATVVSANGVSLTVVAPAHAAGVVDVRVSTRYGISAIVPADRFTYVPPPTITGIAPSSGPSSGGTHVTITGTDLVNVRSVTFGDAAAELVGGSPTSLTVIAPAHDGGTVGIRVTTDYGTSPIVSADLFTYIPWPTITAISPSYGPIRGGVQVHVTGMNFVDVISVTFDGVPGSMAPMYFPGSLTVSPPPHAAGVVDIQVTTTTGTSPVTLADKYTYVAGPGWSDSPYVPHNLQGGPTSISCPSSDFCVLVDRSNYSVYDGATWSTPAPLGDQDVMSVSCTSPTFCVGVDLEGGTITFDGSSWSPELGRHIDDLGGLTAVSCTSPTFCLAVDSSGNVLRFDGTVWSAPVNIDPAQLTGVSCVSPTFCVAVSSDGNALTYSGTAWSAAKIVPMGLTGISCVSPDFCVAVHATGEAIRFDGTTWSAPITIDNVSGTTGVACASTSLCIAVDGQGYAAMFDAAGWSDPDSPVLVDASPFAGLGGVACASTSFCAAFGSDNGAVITFDGTGWLAPVRVLAENSLSDVSCVSPTFCVLADSTDNVYFYDGTGWSQPTELDTSDFFGLSVSCVSPTFCVAVTGSGSAYTYDGTNWSAQVDVSPSGFGRIDCVSETFCLAIDGNGHALTFDGSTWSAVAYVGESPQSAVSCASSTFCVAVSTAGEVFTFDGAGWSGPVVIDDQQLNGVSCGTDSFCVAVDEQGRIITFNGTDWSSPVEIGATSALNAVSCSGSSFCMAVDASGNARTFDGTTWSDPYPAAGELSELSCASPTFCVALNFATVVMWH